MISCKVAIFLYRRDRLKHCRWLSCYYYEWLRRSPHTPIHRGHTLRLGNIDGDNTSKLFDDCCNQCRISTIHWSYCHQKIDYDIKGTGPVGEPWILLVNLCNGTNVNFACIDNFYSILFPPFISSHRRSLLNPWLSELFGNRSIGKNCLKMRTNFEGKQWVELTTGLLIAKSMFNPNLLER